MQDRNPIYLRELKHTDWKDVHAYCSQDRVCHTDRSGEIGYTVHPDVWGQGVATAAAGLMLNFGFEELHLHRIYATCDPRNSGSSKVLTKIGMTYEGRLRDALLIKDGWRDSLMFSMLEHEWCK
ncbi:hypothetical protein PAECIP111894_05899 [Paenibacillus pseudetheri]|uniref:N-acetyltransferase domain-containing protein n=2 Tax=Paenibacillus pseudetheri TaxID=2897682 RepID=A0ABM9BNJ2_9BACL|nr:GNAT family protein [Paenibacillus pseudetheri]CAH1059687.1 hypothetical protein PAECIP111894_05899 [Paenibacillus pseudetheri]